MPIYAWEGRGASGEVKKGQMEAASEAAVNAALKSQQISPLKVSVKSGGGGFDIAKYFAPKVTTRDIVIFTRQFATMIDAGLPLVQCLDMLAKQGDNPTFKKALTDIKGSVESGSTFAEALKRHPDIFDNLFVNLVAAGEVGGILDTILNRLVVHIEKSAKLAAEIKGALRYPVILLCIAIGISAAMLTFVVPIFAKMFADFGKALPAPTQALVDMSVFFRHYIIHVGVGGAAIVFAIRSILATDGGRKGFDSMILKAPIIGDLTRKTAVATFTRVLGIMIRSGVPIIDALEICSKTAGNTTVEKAIVDAKNSISQGKSLAEPLGQSGVFPSMVVQMIAVGEATGQMDAMLGKIADFYDEEVDMSVGALTSVIEPIMMLVIATIVVGMLMGLYLPIFTIAGAAGG